MGEQGLEFWHRLGRGSITQGFSQRHHHRGVQRSRPNGHGLQSLSLLGLRIPGSAGSGCQCQRRCDPDTSSWRTKAGSATSRCRNRPNPASTQPDKRPCNRFPPRSWSACGSAASVNLRSSRALTMLADAYPEMTRAELAALSVGERDARLLALRERLFGDALKSFAECPRCSSGLEFSLDVNELRNRHLIATDDLSAELIAGDIRLRLRPLDSADLQAAADCRDVERARQYCWNAVLSRRNKTVKVSLWATCPPMRRATQRSPCRQRRPADTMLDLQCVGCGHVWRWRSISRRFCGPKSPLRRDIVSTKCTRSHGPMDGARRISWR